MRFLEACRTFRAAANFGARVRRSESGSTAIEFAMVIGPFLGLLFAIIETSLVYFAEFSMDSATKEASRIIFTGQAQSQQFSAQKFKAAVCSKLPAFIPCDSGVMVDVRSYDTFAEAAANLANPINPDGTLSANFEQFNMGGPSKVVVVSVFYDWKLMAKLPGLGDFTGKMGLGLGNLPDGSRLISARTAFLTQPY